MTSSLWTIRFLVVCPVFLLGFGFTYTPYYRRWWQLISMGYILLTGGGFGTNVLPVLTYQFSFQQFHFGRGAATAMILLTILVVFMAFYIGIVMRNIDED